MLSPSGYRLSQSTLKIEHAIFDFQGSFLHARDEKASG